MKKEHSKKAECCCHCNEHHHEHHHNGTCACGHEHGEVDIKQIITGAVLFALALVLKYFTEVRDIFVLITFIVSYIVIGYKVLFLAVKNIIKGSVFDENFLMSVSSVAAFCIGSWSEAVAVMLFYNIGEYFQELAVAKSRKSISDLMDICTDTANVVRDGKVFEVNCEDVNVGEIIIIKPGEKVPLDAVVIEGISEIDTSALTGESKLQNVKENSKILSGSINKSGKLKARVEKEFSESTASKIIEMVESASERKAPAENFITAFSRVYTPIVVIAALLILLIPSLVFGGWSEWIKRGCVFLVISCPCALVISIPLTFFGGIGAASKKGILIKGGNYLEALSKVKTVVFDKTGTLTKGNFAVNNIIPEKGYSEDEVLKWAASLEHSSNHPIAQSICEVADKKVDIYEAQAVQEISGRGIRGVADKKAVAVGTSDLMLDLGVKFEKYSGEENVVYVAVDNKYIGCIVICDEVKPDSKKAVLELKKSGILKTVMLTGDVKSVAQKVAEEIGIDEFHAWLLPDKKVEYFEKIKKETSGGAVFVGDGINDAPVLATANVGIAMGALGSDAAIEAADIVIMNDEPSKVAEALKLSKETKKIVIQNIVFALSVKGAFLILGAFGVAGMWEAVFGDVGVMLIAVLNAMRILKK